MKKFAMMLLCLLLMMSVCVAEEPATEAIVFDPAWAGEEFNMPVPKPPFEQLQVERSDDEMYMILALDPVEIGAVTDEALLSYIEQLKQLIEFDQINTEGFYQSRYDEPKYGFSAQTDAGIVVEFDYGRGGGKIDTVPSFVMVIVWPEQVDTKEANEPALDSTVTAETADEPQTEEKAEVDFGDAEWTMEVLTEPNGNTYVQYKTKKIASEKVDAIVAYLKSAGYTLYEETVLENWYAWGFQNDETQGSLMLIYKSEKGRCQVDIYGDFAK